MTDATTPSDPVRDAGAPGLVPPAYAPPAYGQPVSPPPTYAQPPVAPAYRQPGYPASPYGAPPQASPYGAPPQAPVYGAPPQYGYPAGYAPARRTNALAVVSLVSSLVGIVMSWTLILAAGAIVGVITGHIALGQIRRTGDGGRGMALAGVIVGWITIGVGLLILLGFTLFVGAVSSSIHTAI